MSHAISDIGHDIGSAVSSIGGAITNPANLIGTGLGFGIGGAGGLTGGNLAGNVATGQPIGSNLGGAIGGDLAGLGFGAGAASMFATDPFANIGVDIYGNPLGGAATGGADPFAGIGVDQFGNEVGSAGGGLGAAGLGSGLGSAAGGVASRLLGGGGGGNPLTNFLTGQGGGPSLPSLAPGLAALQYARQQTPIDTSQLQSTFNASAANAPAFIQAAQAPLQQAQAGGYGDLLQSQAARGIRGSSFGDQDIANFTNTTNQGIANAGTNAAEAALGLQGSLAGQISNLNALSQQMKNNLYGRAFSSIGQGLSPTPGMGGYGGGGGVPGAAGGASNILSSLGGLGSAFGNGLSSIGGGLGKLFGSPGSSIWGTAPTVPMAGGFDDFTGMFS